MGISWKKRRFDLWELMLISGGVLIIGVIITFSTFDHGPPEETQLLQDQYGPTRNSEHEEEWIIRDFFHDEKGGFFVDVGANDYRVYSNTYYLDVVLEWSGLGIEPLKQFEADYVKYRPRTRFLPFFVSDESNQHAKMFFLQRNPLVTSSEKRFTEQWGKDLQEIDAPTITLNDLLQAEHVSAIDFLSMDIELAEPKALAGFDIQRFRPRLVCIEAHPEVRQQILDYFAHRNYVVAGKYLRVDTNNLWFTPLQPGGPE